MADGFFSLGEMIAGGGIDREGARLEGLDIGSRIKARQATTADALARARLRIDEQENREGLADAVESMGLPRELAVSIRAGVDPEKITGAILEQQEFGNRETLADVTVPFEQRQAAGQAVEGKVVDPFQFGPGGDLFADVFNPGAAPSLSATGPASIEADQALSQQRVAAAKLSDERRLHPDRFKASTKAGSSDKPLAEEILGDTGAISVIPDDFKAEEALGAESFFKGGANAFTDFVGLGVHFPDQARAQTVLNELSARTQIVLRADVPGGRIPLVVQELLARYAEDPTQLFRGDELGRENLTSTVTALSRALQRTKDQINSPTKKTPTKIGKLEDALFALTDLVEDYSRVLASIERTNGPAPVDSRISPSVTPVKTPGGGSFTVEP